MRSKTSGSWILKMAVPTVAVALYSGIGAIAQPVGEGKAENVEKRPLKAKRANKQKNGAVQQQIKRLEAALGAPLTEQQKADIRTAFEAYQESLAKSVGLTTQELQEKMRQNRRNNARLGRNKDKAEPKAEAAAPAPAAAPAASE